MNYGFGQYTRSLTLSLLSEILVTLTYKNRVVLSTNTHTHCSQQYSQPIGLRVQCSCLTPVCAEVSHFVNTNRTYMFFQLSCQLINMCLWPKCCSTLTCIMNCFQLLYKISNKLQWFFITVERCELHSHHNFIPFSHLYFARKTTSILFNCLNTCLMQ